MKLQFLSLIISAIMIADYSNGQNLSLGPRFGANFSNINGLSNNSVRTGWELGGFIIYKPLKNLGFSADLLLSTKGSHISHVIGDESSSESWNYFIDLVYLEVPLLCNIYLGDEASSLRPRLFAGPSIAARISAKETLNYKKEELASDSSYSSSSIVNSKYKGNDMGIMAGAGFDYNMCKNAFFSLDIRYMLGLIDLRSHSGSYSNALFNRNLTIILGIGYRIGY